ncbi:MAG: (2Fe-2S)-binding protein [Candidatus Binataceae bacterium]
MYVCVCNALTDRQIRSQSSNDGSVAAVYRGLGARPKCGKCIPIVKQIVEEKNISGGNLSPVIPIAAAG